MRTNSSPDKVLASTPTVKQQKNAQVISQEDPTTKSDGEATQILQCIFATLRDTESMLRQSSLRLGSPAGQAALRNLLDELTQQSSKIKRIIFRLSADERDQEIIPSNGCLITHQVNESAHKYVETRSARNRDQDDEIELKSNKMDHPHELKMAETKILEFQNRIEFLQSEVNRLREVQEFSDRSGDFGNLTLEIAVSEYKKPIFRIKSWLALGLPIDMGRALAELTYVCYEIGNQHVEGVVDTVLSHLGFSRTASDAAKDVAVSVVRNMLKINPPTKFNIRKEQSASVEKCVAILNVYQQSPQVTQIDFQKFASQLVIAFIKLYLMRDVCRVVFDCTQCRNESYVGICHSNQKSEKFMIFPGVLIETNDGCVVKQPLISLQYEAN